VEVGNGILQCLNGFRFVASASHDGLETDVGGGGVPDTRAMP
jgi:hypothetical protein